MAAKFQSTHSAHETCNELINAIKSSNLHFVLQETPHSVYITIRKKFVNETFVKINDENETRQALKCLETNYNSLKEDYERKIANHGEALKTLEDKLSEVESKSKLINRSKEVPQENILKKKQKKVNKNEKKEIEVAEIVESEDTDVNRNLFEASVPINNKFEVLNNTSILPLENFSSTSPSKLVSRSSPTTTKIAINTNSYQPIMSSKGISNLSSKPSPSHTPPGLPPSPSLASSLQSQGQGTNPPPISADYITGINKINLGPRLNDLSKM